ncbi:MULTISPECIES: flagellar type III secretion system pore protein FliP [Leeia]|uniref:Flagellar biosynthetic protein FliP n=1 Tax=Leeia aquatica TaxID=2725557 RepID=A0A847RU14_9NEIS|nr:flagellar type III secretion system pore protein FliP [Leeia aquatica]NLR74700.1 flagellar type III secretion system pore protein FliP [Leeia aquatica]
MRHRLLDWGRIRRWGLPVALALTGGLALAANTLPAFTSQPTPDGGTEYSLSIQTLLLLTSLTFLPAILLMMTAFTRIVIVLSLLRQAMGTIQSPPNQVIVGMSLFLTLFVMAPTLEKVYTDAYVPFSQDQINFNQALEAGGKPLKAFMLKHTREKDLALFIELSGSARPNGPEDVGFKALVPAYVTSELKTAFQIGFLIYIPFLIIDMVVASVLMSMGMMMISPVVISLPFKLMLFVLVDGWPLLIGALVKSFYV